jgi:hypothetical protein
MFEHLRNRFAGRRSWPVASASISSAEHREGGRGNPDGYFYVAYSFWIDGHIYGGEYSTRYEMQKDDTIEVRYNPKDPNINFNPESDFIYQHGLPSVFAVAGVGIAIATGLFLINR